jgi:hypothetical protein
VSHETAWHETLGMEGLRKECPEGEDMVWGAAVTKHTTSSTHIDDDGLSTTIHIKAGAKLWVVLQPKPRVSSHHMLGDMSSIYAFPWHFKMGDTGKEVYDAEGVLLIPGCEL